MPAWEYPDPDDQWIHATSVNELVRTQYDILIVNDDGTYKEHKSVAKWSRTYKEASLIRRNDLDYDETKEKLKKAKNSTR